MLNHHRRHPLPEAAPDSLQDDLAAARAEAEAAAAPQPVAEPEPAPAKKPRAKKVAPAKPRKRAKK